MKKIKLVLLVVFLIILFVVSFHKINNVKGEGTFENPYYIKDVKVINELEEKFKEIYPNLLEDTTIEFSKDADFKWYNKESIKSKTIYVESIRYIGSQMQVDMMIDFTCDGVEEKLKKDVINRFKNEEIMITTSYYSLDYERKDNINTSMFNSSNINDFTVRLARDSQQNHAKMIICYKLMYNNEWYSLSSLIHVDTPQYIKTLSKEY